MTSTLKNDFLSATIKHFGAELISLKSNFKEYIWEGNSVFWGKHSPVLFPIVGTLKDNSYLYNNKKYEMSRHGFARDKEFTVISQSDIEIVFSLKYDDETLKIYPFKFELQLHYTLSKKKVSINYKIINLEEIEIPFSIGAHPAFALEENFENYSLEFQEQEVLKCFTLENDLLSNNNYEIELKNKKLPLSYSTFKNDALIFKSLQSKEITILENENPILKVKFNDFNNLGIWTKINASFICIEPWLGYSDTLNTTGKLLEKEEIKILSSKSSIDYQFSIEIL
ncbi:aldose 1-epimerase family protein [Flavobacterium sp.]|uniref:aldose 1-epimerase family protein n=1 Tax=Flavobacterium sp. TaxID=239 RepID=UPI003751A0FE